MMSNHPSSAKRFRAVGRNERHSHDLARLTARPARVIVTPVDAPLHHPLSKRDVQRVLSVLPPESTEKLRSVSLLGELRSAGGYPVLVSYRKQGFIRLHALSARPWRIGPLRAAMVADLLRYGARVEAGPTETRITWPPEALRLFCTVCALMPGISRHRREQEGQGEHNAVVRALDADAEPWLVSDLALHQWGEFLRESSREARAGA